MPPAVTLRLPASPFPPVPGGRDPVLRNGVCLCRDGHAAAALAPARSDGVQVAAAAQRRGGRHRCAQQRHRAAAGPAQPRRRSSQQRRRKRRPRRRRQAPHRPQHRGAAPDDAGRDAAAEQPLAHRRGRGARVGRGGRLGLRGRRAREHSLLCQLTPPGEHARGGRARGVSQPAAKQHRQHLHLPRARAAASLRLAAGAAAPTRCCVADLRPPCAPAPSCHQDWDEDAHDVPAQTAPTFGERQAAGTLPPAGAPLAVPQRTVSVPVAAAAAAHHHTTMVPAPARGRAILEGIRAAASALPHRRNNTWAG